MSPHATLETYFDTVAVPDTIEHARRLVAELERDASHLIGAARFAAQHHALDRAHTFCDAERRELLAAIGWRHAMLIDDAWLWAQLQPWAGCAAPAARDELSTWAQHVFAPLRQRVRQNRHEGKMAEGLQRLNQKGGDQADASEYALAGAERVMRGDLSPLNMAGYWTPVNPTDGTIDWAPSFDDIERQVVLRAARLNPQMMLAEGFEQTGEHRFLRRATEYLADVTWQFPGNVMVRWCMPRTKVHWGLDALDVAVRTRQLLDVTGLGAVSNGFDGDELALVLKTLYWCGMRGLEFAHKRCHNIVFFEAGELARLGFYGGAFRQASSWREAGQQRLIGALRGSIMADGSNAEAQFGYHTAYVTRPADLFTAAADTGVALDETCRATAQRKLRAAVELWAKTVTPTRTVPPLGDAAPQGVAHHMADYGARFEAPMAQAVAQSQDDARWPARTAFLLPVQRYAVMRSGWSADDVWAGVQLRGWHHGHDHYDLFHVEMQAGARRLLADSGIIDYSYNRARCQHVRAHNTLAVDHANPHTGVDATDVGFHTTASFDWVEGLSTAYSDVAHRRAVCFLRPNCFVIFDRVRCLGDARQRRYDVRYQLGAEVTAAFDGLQVRTTDRATWNVTLRFCVPDEQWTLCEEAGFIATGYMKAEERPVARLTNSTDAGFALATVVTVRAPGETEDGVTDAQLVEPRWLNAGDGQALKPGTGVGLIVHRAGTTHTLMWSDPGYGEKAVGAWATDGTLLVAAQRDDAPAQVAARDASCVFQGERAVADAAWTDLSAHREAAT